MLAPLRIAALSGALAVCACSPAPDRTNSEPLRTVESLDVARYMGTWFEIAKYPNRFQTQCVGDTSANYTLQPDSTVRVVNRCRLASGEMDEAVGTARQVGPAKFEVRFAPWWLGWLPAVWGNYWVIDLDPAYRLAAVSEPGRDYLWVLSRTPTVDAAAYQALLDRLRGQGFDISRLR